MTSSKATAQTKEEWDGPPEELGAAALGYAKRGWKVFPCHGVTEEGLCTCADRECKDQGKHPRTPNGFYDASLDESKISAWFDHGFRSNLAVVFPENYCVLDLDGLDAMQWAKAREIEPSMTASFFSRPNHCQLIFTLPDGFRPKRKIKKLFKTEKGGVDLFPGGAGYSVGPPSRHLCGTIYEWATDPDDIAEMPPHLVEEIEQVQQKEDEEKRDNSEGTWSQEALRGVGEGERNDTLHRLVSRRRALNLSLDEAELLAKEFCSRCLSPLEWNNEQKRTLESAYSKPPGKSFDQEAKFDPDSIPIPANVLELTALEPEDRPFLLGPVIHRGSYGMIYGPSGAGKSILAQGLAGACSAGAEFGPFSAAGEARVLYVDAEMSLSHWTERSKTFAEVGLPFDEILLLSQKGNPDQLPVWDSSDSWFNLAITSIVKRAGIELVVLDTVSALNPDADENDPSSVVPFNKLSALLAPLGCSVIVIHHSNKGDKVQAGSAARIRQLDWVILVDPAEGGMWSATLRLKKCRSPVDFPDAFIHIAQTSEGLQVLSEPSSMNVHLGTTGNHVDQDTEKRLQNAVKYKRETGESFEKVAKKYDVKPTTLKSRWKQPTAS